MKLHFQRKYLPACMAMLLGCSIALPLGAQTAATPPAATPAAQALAGAPDLRASQWIGKQVNNAQGEQVGKIEDLIIDVTSEKVHYAVLSFGGFLGVGDKLFAYPIQAFRPSNDGTALVLNVDQEQLKKAPGFERDQRPNWTKDSYRSEVDRFFFKEDTMRRAASGARMLSVKEVIGKDVNDRAAHSAGNIEEVIVNFGHGRAYAILDYDQTPGPDSKMLILPLSAFTFPSRPELDLVLNIDRGQINQIRAFDQNKWPDLNAPQYQKDLSSYLSSFQTQGRARPGSATSGASQ